MAEFLVLVPSSQWTAIHPIVLRLVVAAALGGAIGLEREISRKPAGLRTQLFICMGAAFFTILSNDLAGTMGGDHTRIAAQIIPGIGFMGAGSILHSRGSVTGLTTAATMFVVASIGMATGGGLYGPALFATVLALVSLKILGLLETRFKLKPLVLFYDVVGPDTDRLLNTINGILADEHQVMQTVQISRLGHSARVQFTIDSSQKEHQVLLQRLRQSPALERVLCSETPEE